MSENETKLIEMIRNHPNPEKAFLKALEIITLFISYEMKHNSNSRDSSQNTLSLEENSIDYP